MTEGVPLPTLWVWMEVRFWAEDDSSLRVIGPQKHNRATTRVHSWHSARHALSMLSDAQAGRQFAGNRTRPAQPQVGLAIGHDAMEENDGVLACFRLPCHAIRKAA